MENKDNLSELIRMSCSRMYVPDEALSQRVMFYTAARLAAKARRRSRISLLVSLGSIAVLFVGFVFLMINYPPVRISIGRYFEFADLTYKLQSILPPITGMEWIGTVNLLPVLVLSVLCMVTMCWMVSRTFYK